MNKKVLNLVIWIMVLSIVLIGCGGSSSEEGEQAVSTTAEPATVAEPVTEEETEAKESEQARLELADAPESYYYEYVLVTDGVEQMAFKIWSDGTRVKFEGGMEGETYYMDYEKEEAYLYMPADNMMMKMPMEGIDSGWDSPFMMAAQIEDDVLDGLKKTGEETIDGKKCSLYEYDYGQGKYTYVVWEDEGLIVKMIMELDGQPTYEYYFKDLVINENFDIELELPKDVQIIGG